MDVLDALEATAGIADQQASSPDGLLVDLAHLPGVDASSIEIASHPRKGFHGHHTATWTQDGSVHVAEGSTLEVALRRAVRQARAVSAYPSVERAASRAGERP